MSKKQLFLSIWRFECLFYFIVLPDSFNDNALLNDVERKNLELIKARETVLGGTNHEED